ncbi:hypothetical protein Zm00014a_031101 [Zea mays]|uniref:ABC transporter domain-containing protein n=1 Tax=Zea mays TaxID=4577 RepID=A0A3L6DX46_MAIZE|nr:hypothetical protein Zm00014a_031101 [Zea mays]
MDLIILHMYLEQKIHTWTQMQVQCPPLSMTHSVQICSQVDLCNFDGTHGVKLGYAQVKFLKGFSKDAKTVVLVGESGSGKSMIIALLECLYDPDSVSQWVKAMI